MLYAYYITILSKRQYFADDAAFHKVQVNFVLQIDEIALFCYNIYILNSSIVPDTEIVMNGHKCAERFMQRRLSRFFNVSHIHIIKKS